MKTSTRTDKWTPAAIAALRRELHLSQQDLAGAVGANRVSVSNWERGFYVPSHKHLRALDKLERSAG